jgi:hypothetical protein
VDPKVLDVTIRGDYPRSMPVKERVKGDGKARRRGRAQPKKVSLVRIERGTRER